MALTKNKVKEILSTAGVTDETLINTAVESIMQGHIASIDALREERDNYKVDAEKLPDIQKELNDLKAKGDPDWQKKYEDEHSAFDTYKKQIADDRVRDQKKTLYRKALADCKVSEKRIDSILKLVDIDALKLKDDKLEDEANIKKGIETEWADFIMHEEKKPAGVDNPPANNGGSGKSNQSRAAQLAAAYHESLYGKTKGE